VVFVVASLVRSDMLFAGEDMARKL